MTQLPPPSTSNVSTRVGPDDVLDEMEHDWAATGLSGSLLARNLSTGTELGFNVDQVWPLASVVKLPIALVVHQAFENGELDPAELIRIEPQHATSGPTGLSLLRHPGWIAAEDLVQFSLAVSDNAATDLLLDRLPPEEITARLTALGVTDLMVRHSMGPIYARASDLSGVDPGLATAGRTPGGGNLIPELDPNRANSGTARAMVDLLERIWQDRIATATVCARIRETMRHQLVRHRLAAELASDSVRIASKTGSFLDLRHEAGVIEIDHQEIAVVALTRSAVPAAEQLEADFAIGHAARLAVDALRD